MVIPKPYHTVEFECFVASHFEGYVAKLAPHGALKLFVSGKWTFDERVVLHGVWSGSIDVCCVLSRW